MYFLANTNKNLSRYCYAPAGNLYFRMDGQVSFCSSGNSDVIGLYPLQSLNDIVHGEKRQALRQKFRAGEVLKGCEKCQRCLQIENHQAATYRIYNKYTNRINRIVTLEFELSNRCNLECVMCSGYFSESFNHDLASKPAALYGNSFVQELKPLIPGIKRLNFKGGEPFLIDLYYDIWEMVAEVNPSIVNSVTTNGTILNKRVKAALEKGIFNINVSIDSLNKEGFEAIRRHASYDVFRRNLDYFIEYCRKRKTSFTACTCLMTNNYRDIPRIFEFANQNGFSVYMNYVEEPHHLSLKYLPKNEILNIVGFLYRQMPDFRFYRDKQNRDTYHGLLQQLTLWIEEPAAANKYEPLKAPAIDGHENFDALNFFNLMFSNCFHIEDPIEKASVYNLQMEKFTLAYKKAKEICAEESIIAGIKDINPSDAMHLFNTPESELTQRFIQFTTRQCEG